MIPPRSTPVPVAAAVAPVFAGGCAGGLARHALDLALPAGPLGWPWGVVVANTAGAFLLAVLLVRVAAAPGTAWWWRPLLGTGFCGAFTTMSGVVLVGAVGPVGRSTASGLGFVLVSAALGLAAVVAGTAAAGGRAGR